jgi:transposase
MAQTLNIGLRMKIVDCKAGGMKMTKIAQELGVNYNTVRTLCKRHQAEGTSGLVPKYANCGRPLRAEHEKAFRLVRLLKWLHPTWGVPYLVQRIELEFPDLPLQSIRHYQRRLSLGSQKVPSPILPEKIPVDRARQAHDTWEIDAKERLELADGQEACYLNITDEKTNAMLQAEVFPPQSD